MRTLALALAVIAACGDISPIVAEPTESDSAELMSVALVELITHDHTFGQGPPPFSEFLIEESTVLVREPSSRENPDEPGKQIGPVRPLTDLERSTIEEAISKHGPVRWIAEPGEWRTNNLEPKIEGSVILGVGAPRLDDEGALVPVSLWCGGLCGTWFTYRLQLVDGAWQVTGKEGPVAIS